MRSAFARPFFGVFRLVLTLALLLGSTVPALANGRFPASNAVVFDPRDSKTVWVRATFGLLVTRDGGESWRWICEKAVGFSGQEDPTYAVTPQGTIVGGTFEGLAVSRDNGCTFAFAGGPKAHMLIDLAMRKNGEIVGISSVYSKAGDGGSLYDNHLAVSSDDARTITIGSSLDPTFILETVEVADSDPARLYVSAVRGEVDKRQGALLVSYDAGMSWVERRIELVSGELAPHIAAVDPKNAERLYVRTSGGPDARSRLLVTDDAGKTWKKIHESASPLLGFALAPDGARVFAGSREGLVASGTEKFELTRGAGAEIQCLGATDRMLWACSSERSGFFVGASRSAGKAFDAKLHLEEIKGPLECPAESSVAKACTDEWPKLRRELGLPEPGAKKGNGGDPGAPALKGRATRTGRSRSSLGAVFAIGLVGIIAYYVLKKFRK